MPPKSEKVNWFETWNRRSRLRNATRMLEEPENSADAPPPRAKKALNRQEKEYLCGIAPPGFDNVMPNMDSNMIAESLLASKATTPLTKNGDVSVEEQPVESEANADYKFFLDHLRFTGKSYVFEGVVNGSPIFLTYEEDDGSRKVIQSVPKTKNGKTRSNGEAFRVRKTCKGKRGREETSRKRCVGRKKSRTESLSPSSSDLFNNCPSDGNADEDCLQTDKDYRTFPNHVKECNGSMILKLKNNVIRYEGAQNNEPDFQEADVKHEPTRAQVPVQQAVAQHLSRRQRVLFLDERAKALDEPVGCKEVVKFEPVDYTDEVEEIVHDLPIQTVVCGDVDNSCFSALDLQPYSGDAGASTSVQKGDCVLKALTVKVSGPFRDRLEKILQNPFDQDEYEDLWKRANNHGSVVKYKHLRRDSIPYETNEPSRSFLDHYADLKEMIMKADVVEALKLLRGFFFWLENLSHEGAFRPWTISLSDTNS